MLSPSQQRRRSESIARANERSFSTPTGGGSLLTETALLIVLLVIVAVIVGSIVWPHVAPILRMVGAA